MRSSLLIAIVGALLATTTAPLAAHNTFVQLHFAERTQYSIVCAANYECDIQLEPDETVNDGFNSAIAAWDPHIGYQGDVKRHIPLTPHLVLRPQRAGLRANIVLTTTRRTYYLLATSTGEVQPTYYSFVYDDETYHSLANLALATQTALRAQSNLKSGGAPAPSASPALDADLSSVCFDFNYSYQIDPAVAPNHQPRQKPSNEQLPQKWVPRVVCTDGSHTFIEFPAQRETPTDLPISFALTDEGDTLANYTFNAMRNRYTIDGVYDTIVMELGSQYEPLRVKIIHTIAEPSVRRSRTPIPIVPPQSTAAPVPTPAPSIVPSPPAIATPAPTATPKKLHFAPVGTGRTLTLHDIHLGEIKERKFGYRSIFTHVRASLAARRAAAASAAALSLTLSPSPIIDGAPQ